MPEDELARRRRQRSGAELRDRLRASRERDEEHETPPLNLDPRSTYEVLTRQMVSDLADELREIPCPDAENGPSCPPESAQDADTDQLPYPGQDAIVAGPEGRVKWRRWRWPEQGWARLLAILGGITALGQAARTVYSFAEWVRRLLGDS